MRVLKFGGTSVADAAAIARVVGIVSERRGARTVVVSALAGVTDTLLEISRRSADDLDAALASLGMLVTRHRSVADAFTCDDTRRVLDAALDGIASGAAAAARAIAAGVASPALVDRLLACGELWSSRIVSAAFVRAGIPVQWIDARHLVRTDGRHGEATPDLVAIDRAVTRLVRPALALDRVVVVGGFVGSGPDGATTTLGRGGSDYSAAVLGACLLADEIEIWTDVDGVFTADPRVVPGARVLPALSYEDAETLATFGAKVLHPRTIGPAASREIPVRVLNSHRPGSPGTRIDGSAGDVTGYTAVSSRAGLSMLEFTALDGSAPRGFAARVLQALEEERITILVCEVHRARVCVAADGTFDSDALRTRVEAFAELRSRNGLSAVCAVGDLLPKPFVMVVEDRHAHAIVTRLHDSFAADATDARERAA
ncbi:MAG TPA: aspartate kinase, partial [Vicinamibacterales bacterium]|nr:aspartate kinase [Vicinamibacterales bacterium]